MSTPSFRKLAPKVAADDVDPAAAQPGVARVSDDPLARAVRLAIASSLPREAALRSIEGTSIGPLVGLNVPESVQ